MRKLDYELNWSKLKHFKADLVPILFTEHQFHLIEKKAKKQDLTASEKNEFSRAISKKMNAIQKISGKENVFIYGKEQIIPERLQEAKKYLHQFSRKFKNKPIIIAGSFLYSKKYQDLDIFIIEKYEKEDFKVGKLHFNYLKPESQDSLFFNSLIKICVANFDLSVFQIKERITSARIISKFQEINQDLNNNSSNWLKMDLREFLLDCYYASSQIVLNSQQLKFILNNLLKKKNKEKIIQKIFIQALLMGFKDKKIKTESLKMIKAYQDLIKEYKHKENYQKIINCFQEVLENAS